MIWEGFNRKVDQLLISRPKCMNIFKAELVNAYLTIIALRVASGVNPFFLVGLYI